MDPRTRSIPAAAIDEREDALPWVREGIVAGLIGAAVIAVFFFAVDVANGRPLWTPHALGTALFGDGVPTPHARVSPALVGAYTFVHGYVFVSVGLIAAFLLDWMRPSGGRRWLGMLALAVPIFVAFSLLFFSFRWLRGPDAVLPFGFEWVNLTNALAAVAMAAFLVLRLSRARD